MWPTLFPWITYLETHYAGWMNGSMGWIEEAAKEMDGLRRGRENRAKQTEREWQRTEERMKIRDNERGGMMTWHKHEDQLKRRKSVEGESQKNEQVRWGEPSRREERSEQDFTHVRDESRVILDKWITTESSSCTLTDSVYIHPSISTAGHRLILSDFPGIKAWCFPADGKRRCFPQAL